MKNSCLILLWLVVTNILVLFPCSPRAQTVPDEAVRVANDRLQSMIEGARRDSTHFKTYWDTDIVKDYSDLWLAEPYAEYLMPSQAIYDFADSGEPDFTGESGRMGYTFPVFYGDEWVVTIDVALCGETWKFVGGAFKRGNIFVPWLLSLREQYPFEKGYQMSLVRIDDIGDFLLLHKNEKITHIAPAGSHRRIEGFESDERGMGPLYPVEQAIPGLRAAAIEYKKRWHDSARPHEE